MLRKFLFARQRASREATAAQGRAKAGEGGRRRAKTSEKKRAPLAQAGAAADDCWLCWQRRSPDDCEILRLIIGDYSPSCRRRRRPCVAWRIARDSPAPRRELARQLASERASQPARDCRIAINWADLSFARLPGALIDLLAKVSSLVCVLRRANWPSERAKEEEEEEERRRRVAKEKRSSFFT